MRKVYDRKKLIQLIHVARREVAELQDEGTYRAMLMAKTGKDSCLDMRDDQLQDVLDHLKKSGFKIRAAQNPSRPLADDAECKKIRALWLFLHQISVVKNPSEAALAAYVKRLTRVDALQWLNGDQATTVIEALKMWAMRFLPKRVKQEVETVRDLPMSALERELLSVRLTKAFKHETFDPMLDAWETMQDIKTRYSVQGDAQ